MERTSPPVHSSRNESRSSTASDGIGDNPTKSTKCDKLGDTGTNCRIDQVAEALGVMKVDDKDNSSLYLGSIHWVSIMSEVGLEPAIGVAF